MVKNLFLVIGLIFLFSCNSEKISQEDNQSISKLQALEIVKKYDFENLNYFIYKDELICKTEKSLIDRCVKMKPIIAAGKLKFEKRQKVQKEVFSWMLKDAASSKKAFDSLRKWVDEGTFHYSRCPDKKGGININVGSDSIEYYWRKKHKDSQDHCQKLKDTYLLKTAEELKSLAEESARSNPRFDMQAHFNNILHEWKYTTIK